MYTAAYGTSLLCFWVYQFFYLDMKIMDDDMIHDCTWCCRWRLARCEGKMTLLLTASRSPRTPRSYSSAMATRTFRLPTRWEGPYRLYSARVVPYTCWINDFDIFFYKRLFPNKKKCVQRALRLFVDRKKHRLFSVCNVCTRLNVCTAAPCISWVYPNS